jgi:2'-5' RNA ligase
MRLFIAVTPPQDALAELDAAVAGLRADWPGLRWAGLEKWHLTLAFLGEVSDDRLAALTERLERATGRYRVLSLRIGRGGAFPSPVKARVLCAHIDGEAQALTELGRLAASVAAAARRAGAPPPDEGRRYRPHLTLARSKRPANLGPLVATLSGFRGSPWDATTVELIKSQTGPQARYDTVGEWALPRPGEPSDRPATTPASRASDPDESPDPSAWTG